MSRDAWSVVDPDKLPPRRRQIHFAQQAAIAIRAAQQLAAESALKAVAAHAKATSAAQDAQAAADIAEDCARTMCTAAKAAQAAAEDAEFTVQLLGAPAASEAAKEALTEAARNGHRQVVELLLRQGVDVTWTALHEATRNGQQECVKLLIKRSAKGKSEAKGIKRTRATSSSS